MRTYEALYIGVPELADDDIQTMADEVAGLVTTNGGSIVRSEIWGKRKLAYDVGKHSEGVYVLLRFEAEPSVLPKLENHFRLSDTIIRHLVVHFDERTLRLEAEQLKRNEENLRASANRQDGDEDEDRPPRRRDDEDRPPRRREDAPRHEEREQRESRPPEAAPAPQPAAEPASVGAASEESAQAPAESSEETPE